MQKTPLQDFASSLRPTPHSLRTINKSTKLTDVCYEIRGAVMDEARLLEERGEHVLKLNIGNPAPFGFDTPASLMNAVVDHLPKAQGYADSQGIPEAREAIVNECHRVGLPDIGMNDVYLGNGVSELIVMSMQGLLNEGDEILVPAPDYPLWSAAIRLAGGIPVHYRCDENADWFPDLHDIQSKTNRRTLGIVVINPNNPTGAVYDRTILTAIMNWAQQNDLIVFADEIYSKITYEDARYIPCASLTDEVLVVTFDGLSKAYRAAGFRTGWMVLSGPRDRAQDYIEGLNILASMRLCANVPSQFAVHAALQGSQSIYALTRPGGQLFEQRAVAMDLLSKIEGISCVKPRGALYMFPKIDTAKFNIRDDEQLVLDLLRAKKTLVVHGTGFGLSEPDHFRLVFLPTTEVLTQAINGIGDFLSSYKQD